jgi:hypothetical protein
MQGLGPYSPPISRLPRTVPASRFTRCILASIPSAADCFA